MITFSQSVSSQMEFSDSSSGFNVYCTSNKDATGSCINLNSQKLLDCIIIPGQLIDCRGSMGKRFQCVLYSQVTETQAEFFCNPDSKFITTDDVLDESSFNNVFITL